ncbi:hypothetical protein RCC89_00940 [Cytophagaceae bacterium ABcell3]|nr:hypothetical protein RCC89_00940 [Cytophagaceae bacterium ABcell3]
MTFSLEKGQVFSGISHVESVVSDEDTDSGQQEKITEASIEAVIPFVYVDLDKLFFHLIVKPSERLSAHTLYEACPQITGKFFKVLFNYIISPNAP